MTPSRALSLALALLAGGPAAGAQETGSAAGKEVLHFSDPRQRIAPAPEDNAVTAIFHFANVGHRRVAVRGGSSCHCLSLAADRDGYDPGQTGTLTATLSLDLHDGLVIRSVTFATDDPDQPIGNLTLDLLLPPIPQFHPALLQWTVQEAAAPKAIDVTLPPGYAHAVTAVHAGNAAFTASLAADPALPGYRITVTPTSTERPAQCSISVGTDCARIFTLSAIVRAADAAGQRR